MSWTRLLVFVVITGLSTTLWADQTRIFPLHHANPEQVLQTLQSLYGDELKLGPSPIGIAARGDEAQLNAVEALIAELDRAPATLILTLSEAMPSTAGSQSYSTRPQHQWTVQDGSALTLHRGTTRQQPTLQYFWVAVEEVTEDLESIALQPRLLGQDQVEVSVEFHRKLNGRFDTLNTTVSGKLGEWLSLQNVVPSASGNKVYGTSSRSELPAAIRIDRKDATQ